MGSDYSRSSSTKDALQISTVAIKAISQVCAFSSPKTRSTSDMGINANNPKALPLNKGLRCKKCQ
jgi:hypothetical protein